MQPIEDLLHRIVWDAEFGKGSFAVGYYDRVDRSEHVVPFASMTIDAEHPGTFALESEAGEVARIPLHRIRTVYRDGSVIWHRPDSST